MTPRSRFLPGLALAAATAVVLTGCEAETEPAAELETDTLTDQRAVDATMDQEIYEARLEALDGSGVTGAATFTWQDDELQVTVAATGLDPETRVPQHVHMNATCEDAGGILLNLDNELSAPNDGEPRGDAYPESSAQGDLRFEANRSMDELRTALQENAEADTAADATQADTGQAGTTGTATGRSAAGQAVMDTLNLGERVVNLHGEDMQPIACGPLERMEPGQQQP